MLKKLVKPNPKKIKKARTVYKIYIDTGSLHRTREATGLGIDTIRRYIALTEDINNKRKLSTKDRYYRTGPKDNKDTQDTRDTDPIYNIYNNKDIYKDNINNIIPEIISNKEDNKDKIGNIGKDNIIPSSVPDLKDLKNKLIIKKLDEISAQYLTYLEDPEANQLRKTSLKDRAVIAGILLDKKILLEHKQADVIKNASIIFNLFGNNANLADFIALSQGRQHRLQAREPKKML